jgi:hypothetical protein
VASNSRTSACSVGTSSGSSTSVGGSDGVVTSLWNHISPQLRHPVEWLPSPGAAIAASEWGRRASVRAQSWAIGVSRLSSVAKYSFRRPAHAVGVRAAFHSGS